MKKSKTLVAIALAALMILIMTECTGRKSDKAVNKPVTKSETNAEQDTDTEAAAGEFKVTFIELGSVRCIPCQQMQPVMDSIRARYGEQVNVVFHDVWTQQGAPFADKYGVSAIPTQVFLDENGKEYFRHVGYFPLVELVRVLEKKGVEKQEL